MSDQFPRDKSEKVHKLFDHCVQQVWDNGVLRQEQLAVESNENELDKEEQQEKRQEMLAKNLVKRIEASLSQRGRDVKDCIGITAPMPSRKVSIAEGAIPL